MGKSALCRIELAHFAPSEPHKLAIAAALATEVADLWHPSPWPRSVSVRWRSQRIAATGGWLRAGEECCP